MFEEPERPLMGFKNKYIGMDVFDKRNFQMKLFSHIVIWSAFGLDPHPD
jgi:hypothetical protein